MTKKAFKKKRKASPQGCIYSFPLAGFDTSESATPCTPIYLKACEKNKLAQIYAVRINC